MWVQLSLLVLFQWKWTASSMKRSLRFGVMLVRTIPKTRGVKEMIAKREMKMLLKENMIVRCFIWKINFFRENQFFWDNVMGRLLEYKN